MAFRSIQAELGLNSAPYIAGLNTASAETKVFAAEVTAAGKDADVAFSGGATAAKSYAAAATIAADATKKAETNVAALAKRNTELAALKVEYEAIAASAVDGSARQVAANRLVEVSQKRLVASGAETAAAVEVSEGLMSGAGEKLGNVFEQLGLRVERSHGLVGAALKGMTQDVSTMGVGVGAVVGVTAAAFGVLAIEGVKHFEDLTNEVRNFQHIAGTSAEDSSKLVYAMQELGVEPQQAAAAFGIFSRNLVDHADKVREDGVQIAYLKNGNIDTIGSLYNLADAFQKVGPGAEGTALALDLMGRGGKALIPVLLQGRDGLKQFFDEAQSHGLVFSQKDLDDARSLALATNNLHEAFNAMEISLARDVIPQLTGLAHGFADVLDVISSLHLPVVQLLEVGAAALTASKGVAVLGAATSAAGAEWAGFAVASAAGPVGAAVALSGALLLVANSADKHSSALQNVDKTVIGWESHIPLVGGALAALDSKVAGVTKSTADHAKVTEGDFLAMQEARAELEAYGETVDPTITKVGDLTNAEKQLLQQIQQHGDTMASTAAQVGISADQLAESLGYQGRAGVDSFKAEEKAAQDFVAAVQSAQNAASAAYMKTADVVSNLSASSLASDAKRTASSAKAADTQVNDDTRVADAIQHVADLQEQYAEQATSDRQAYADKVASADQAMADADQNYADTVQSTNDKIAQADQKLADDRISSAQSVADAQQRLADDRASGAQSVADAQQKLADDEARQALARNPAALARLNNEIQLRDARAAVTKAQEAAADKEKSDLDAIGKAQQNQIKTLEADQDAADKARVDGAKQVEKAEDAVTKAREAQNKLAAEANTIGVETIQQQREMQRAVEAVTKAQQSLSTASISTSAATAAAVELTVADVKKFYDDSTTQADKFQGDIRTAISLGYDPALISRLLQEGSTEAQPLLNVLVNQSDKSFVEMVNNAEKKMRDYDFQIRELARLTTMAAKSQTDQMNNDLTNAMSIMEANAGEGGRKTSEALATQLGLGVAEVQRIAQEFGITLADGINPVLVGVGADQIVLHAEPSTAGNPTGKFLMASGGKVPGQGNGDTVPAMLTPGEFVVRKDVVAAMGPEFFHALNAQHFATGGFVTGADVPKPPDLSAYGDKVGYAGTKVEKYEYDQVVAYLNNRPPPSRTGSGATAAPGIAQSGGATYHGQVADWVAAGVALAGRPDSWDYPEVNIAMFESGGDPNAIDNWDSNAQAGTPSKGLMQVIDPTFRANMVAGHGDIWNPVDNVAAATNYIAGRYGTPWNTPGERSIAAGGSYQGYSEGGLVRFASYDQGGYLEPGLTMAWNGLGVREPVGVGAGAGQAHGAGGGDIHISVTVQGSMVGTTKEQVAGWLVEPLRAAVKRKSAGNPGYWG